MKSKQKELEKVAGKLSELEKAQQDCVEQHSAAQKHFHAVSAGLSSNQDGEDASLNDQLMGEYSRLNSQCSLQRFSVINQASTSLCIRFVKTELKFCVV